MNVLQRPKSDWRFMLRALRHRNYRMFFIGQGISLIGTWMQQIAAGWLVYRLTKSPFWLGVTAFSAQAPVFIFAPVTGVLIDRGNRHRIFFYTQILEALQAFVFAWLALSGNITIVQVLGLSFAVGLIGAFDMPVRHSFVVDMVDAREDLPNAIALNSMLFNAARLVGPAIAGMIIAVANEGICFLLNGLSFLPVILALWAMKIKPRKTAVIKQHLLKELKDGFVFTFSSGLIRYVLFLFAVVSLLGVSYSVLMPVFAQDVLHGGPTTLGFLIGSTGIGALLGALYVASRPEINGLIKKIPLAGMVFGSGLMLFALSRWLWFSILIMAGTGFGMMIQISGSNAVMQNFTDDQKRGRVMSIYTMVFMGMATIGSFTVGAIAVHIGAPLTLFISGLLCVACSLGLAKKIIAQAK